MSSYTLQKVSGPQIGKSVDLPSGNEGPKTGSVPWGVFILILLTKSKLIFH